VQRYGHASGGVAAATRGAAQVEMDFPRDRSENPPRRPCPDAVRWKTSLR
jgi:hypothetical protein